ncbi:MAG: hypothetical protein Q8R38_00470 [Candidatus Omnitrophota bacterium]|nr:hypothetical protein [Candidatus Omnitrophota bacterium]
MGQKSRYQIKSQQRLVRKKARKKLAAKGANLAEYYYGKYYLKPESSGA